MATTAVVCGVGCFTAGLLLTLGCVFRCRKKRDKANDDESQTPQSINRSKIEIKKDLPNTDDKSKKRHSNGSKASATESDANINESTQDISEG